MQIASYGISSKTVSTIQVQRRQTCNTSIKKTLAGNNDGCTNYFIHILIEYIYCSLYIVF